MSKYVCHMDCRCFYEPVSGPEFVTIGGMIGIVRYASKLLFCSFSTRIRDHCALLKASAKMLIPARIYIWWKRDFSGPEVTGNKGAIHQYLRIPSEKMAQ